MSILRRKEILLLPLMAGVLVSLLLAFLLRFEFTIPLSQRPILEIGVCLFIPAKGIVFYLFRLHRSWWHLVSLMDLPRIILANFCASLAACVITLLIVGPPFPKSIFIMDSVLCLLVIFALQFSVRVHREVLASKSFTNGKQKAILIYGAGSAGLTLAKEIRSNNMLGTKALGFLDDDPRKLNRSLIGVPILGKGRDAARIVMQMQRRNTRVSEIVIALPSATGRQMRTAIANCRASGVPFRTVPGLAELLSGKVLSGQLREVSVDDLLGRESVQIDESLIGAKIANKCVMVTGGCGSIGSEICRQIARFAPRKLVIFDQAESDAFMLAMDLRNRCPSLNLVIEIGDVFKQRRIGEVMALHSIEIVFHAAAYKHVPLMEANLIEAVENNIVGTYNVVQAAHRNKVSQLVLISTDKAVNPTSIMGVTKRIAELIVGAVPIDGGPRCGAFVSVRFGNVLASAGSVVQIFKRQIAAGGPVTITHPEMRRYFMSIPEAVQLVLQASTMGKGSELFVLDMGEPVSILELARNMIRLAGLIPDEDIEIRVSGLRPGEKLFEELRFPAEDILPTYHEKIKIFRPSTLPPEVLIEWLQQLQVLLNYRNPDEIKAHLLTLVPEYLGSSPQSGSPPKRERLAPVRTSWLPLVLPETTVSLPFGLPEP
jgi:FlaA1/EpsC-like NDP-sugar epimerase